MDAPASADPPRNNSGLHALVLLIGAGVYFAIHVALWGLQPDSDSDIFFPIELFTIFLFCVGAARAIGRTWGWLAYGAALASVLSFGYRLWLVRAPAQGLLFSLLLFIAVILYAILALFDRIFDEGDIRRVRAEAYLTELRENENLIEKRLTELDAMMPALERKTDRYVQLNELSIQLNASRDLADLLDRSQAFLRQIHPEPSQIRIHVRTEEGQIQRSLPEDAAASWDPLDQAVLETGVPLIVRDIETDYRFDALAESHKGHKSIIASPLLEASRPIGVVRIQHPAAQVFSAEQLRVLSYVTNAMSLSYQILKFLRQAVELSRRDGLTDLYKRWFFDEELRNEFRRALRFPNPLTLIMIDIDDFRKYNNTYGHLVGDSVLRAVSGAVMKAAPESATTARYGGEEIAVILPGVSLAAAAGLGEAMRAQVISDTSEGSIPERVTISVGVALYAAEKMKQPEDLIAAADEALYRAKRGGKNRVEVAS